MISKTRFQIGGVAAVLIFITVVLGILSYLIMILLQLFIKWIN